MRERKREKGGAQTHVLRILRRARTRAHTRTRFERQHKRGGILTHGTFLLSGPGMVQLATWLWC